MGARNLDLNGNMIDINRCRTIKNIIKNMVNEKTEVRIWQRKDDVRFWSFGYVCEYSDLKDKIVLAPSRFKEFKFSKSMRLYFHSSHRTTIFKSTLEVLANGKLQVKIPKIVKREEIRQFDRLTFESTNKKSANIFIKGKLITERVNLIDVSSGGVAMLVDQTTLFALRAHGHIEFGTQNPCGLAGKAAHVRHIASVSHIYKSGTPFYKIGVEFVDD